MGIRTGSELYANREQPTLTKEETFKAARQIQMTSQIVEKLTHESEDFQSPRQSETRTRKSFTSTSLSTYVLLKRDKCDSGSPKQREEHK